LMAHVVHRRCRKGLEVGLGIPEPDDGLHGKSIIVRAVLCNISHN
jgi:hypothetical protein